MPVGDIDVARLVDGDAGALVEASLRRQAAVAGVPSLARAGTGGDISGARVDPPDPVIERVGKIEIAVRVEVDVEGPVQQGALGWPAVPAETSLAGPDRRRDDPGLFRHGRSPCLRRSDISIAFRDRRCKLPLPLHE